VTQRLIVQPFAGLRYRRGDLSGVLAPPYDIITPEQQERLHRRDPHNVVRLELGYGAREDGDQDTFVRRSGTRWPAKADDRYARSAKTLQLWRQEGVLAYDDGPCLYPHSHTFDLRGESRRRLGVLCAVRLTPFEAGMVLPHEGTLAAPREDRRRLMLACQAQISPVLALHDDPNGEITAVISEMTADHPVAEAETSGECHCLWRRRQDELTDRYCELVGQGPLFIADGHHRYETALTVSRELAQPALRHCSAEATQCGAESATQAREAEAHPQAPPEAAFNHVLALLCPAEQPGVVILPTHRLLRLPTGEQRAHLEALVERHFQRREVKCAAAHPREAARTLVQSLEHSDSGALFGMYTSAGGCSLLEVRPEYVPRNPGAGGIDELGTVLIHRLLIDPVLGPGALSTCVEYVTSEAEAVQQVDEGRADCALFLRPTTVEQVKRVAAAGLRMPGKSTYFYPKAPTGLVINDISPGRIIP